MADGSDTKRKYVLEETEVSRNKVIRTETGKCKTEKTLIKLKEKYARC